MRCPAVAVLAAAAVACAPVGPLESGTPSPSPRPPAAEPTNRSPWSAGRALPDRTATLLNELDIVASGRIGEPVEVAGVEIVVHAVDRDPVPNENGYEIRQDGQSWLTADIELRNNATQSFRHGERDFTLIDDQGRAGHSTCCTEYFDSRHAAAEISPGQSVRGTWVFIEHNDAQEQYLIVAIEEMSNPGQAALIELTAR